MIGGRQLNDRAADIRAELSKHVSLAFRVALLTTGAVGLTLAVVSAIVYVTVRAEFESSLDDSLMRRAYSAVDAGFATQATVNGLPPGALLAADIKIAVIQDKQLYSTPSGEAAKAYVGKPEAAVAAGKQRRSMRTVQIDGTPYRVIAVHAGPQNALVLAQSMESTANALDRLRVVLSVVSIAGVVVAGVAGWAVATNGLRPVRRLTSAAEHVARTERLQPIAVTGNDELARLTLAFNSMLSALDASQQRQRQLVADAGHELRTPLTSLRTNIDLLSQADSRGGLSERARAELMGDVRSQLGELTTLVGDLVELARDEPLRRDPEPVDLSEIVTSCVERVRPRASSIEFDVETEPWMVLGEPQLIERAVTNLLDNAAKWSPPLGVVTVRLTDGALTVADTGPGIAEEDLPHVFERFYRSREARMLPGSGLGLAIVWQTARRHGGSVFADRAASGGALMTLRLPGTPPDTPHDGRPDVD